jgi:multidrug efflux pump subunit AcrA (membrane-fusion protein)
MLQVRREAREQVPLPSLQKLKVAALGRVEPASCVIEVAVSNSGRLEQLLVSKEETVEAEQALAYMDAYRVRKAERDYAASLLFKARAELAARTALGSAQLEEAITHI